MGNTFIAGLVIFTALLVGCASSSGFNRGALRESMNQKAVVTDAEIAKTLKLKAQLPKPFKVAIYFAEPTRAASGSGGKWNWTEDEKAQISKLGDALKASGEVSEIFTMNSSVTGLTPENPGSALKNLRLAAARHGADALLVIAGAKDVEMYGNNWAWTYIALAPMLFVKGTTTEAIVMAQASLWDVRNEFLYMTAEGESTQKKTVPLIFNDEVPLVQQARTEAMEKLTSEISAQIKGLTSRKTTLR